MGEAGRVLLAYIHGGTVRAEFMASVINATADPATPIAAVNNLYSGPQLSISRNEIARHFLATGLEWLWCLDSDMAFSPATLPGLLAAAASSGALILGPLVFMQSEQANLGAALPTMYELVDDGGQVTFRNWQRWPADQVVRVDATGAAALLIHRDALRAMAKIRAEHGLWFSEATIGERQFGEDISFCLRAAAAGVGVYIATGIMVGHVKPVMMGEPRP